jgi:ligand-binding sensor domain-containing protein
MLTMKNITKIKCKRQSKIVYLTIMLIALSLSANSQQKYRIDHINMEKGLSWTFVTSICQDEEGYIWIGTAQGLNRYDGYDIVTYWHDTSDDSSISNSQIGALCLDKEGTLWIGTMKGGLNKFDQHNNKFERFVHDPADTNSLTNNSIRDIECDRNNNLWIGTAWGLSKYSIANNAFGRFTHDSSKTGSLSSNSISCLCLDSQDHLWIGTDFGGLNRLNLETEQITRFVHDPKDPNTLSSNAIESIYEDKEGSIWIRTKSRLDKYVTENTFIHYGGKELFPDVNTHGFVASIVEGDDGNLWMTSRDVGLLRFNKRT